MFFWHYNNLFFRIIRYRNFLPLVSILIGGDYNSFGQQIENYLSTYDENTIIIFSCIFIINLYFFNNIFLFVYNYSLTLYTRNIQYRISTDLFNAYIYRKILFKIDKFTKHPIDREHVANYIVKNYKKFRIKNVSLPKFLKKENFG